MQKGYNRARWWFSAKPLLLHVAAVPDQAASEAAWVAYGVNCKRQDIAFFKLIAKLCHRTEHPPNARSHPNAATWRPLVRRFWPRGLVERALRVIRDESTYRYWAHNSSGAAGLFQVLPACCHWWIPKVNIIYAYVQKYLPSLRACGDGWRPWASSGEGL